MPAVWKWVDILRPIEVAILLNKCLKTPSDESDLRLALLGRLPSHPCIITTGKASAILGEFPHSGCRLDQKDGFASPEYSVICDTYDEKMPLVLPTRGPIETHASNMSQARW